MENQKKQIFVNTKSNKNTFGKFFGNFFVKKMGKKLVFGKKSGKNKLTNLIFGKQM